MREEVSYDDSWCARSAAETRRHRRRAVCERLNAEGLASASQLATELPVSRQAIAKHLSQLDSVALVERSEKGRQVMFSARVAPLGDVAGWLETVGHDWDERLEKLRRSCD